MTDKPMVPMPARPNLVPAGAPYTAGRAGTTVTPALLRPAARCTLTHRISRSYRIDLAHRLATAPKNSHVGRHIDIQV